MRHPDLATRHSDLTTRDPDLTTRNADLATRDVERAARHADSSRRVFDSTEPASDSATTYVRSSGCSLHSAGLSSGSPTLCREPSERALHSATLAFALATPAVDSTEAARGPDTLYSDSSTGDAGLTGPHSASTRRYVDSPRRRFLSAALPAATFRCTIYRPTPRLFMYLAEKILMYARNLTLMRRHECAGGVFDFAGLSAPPSSAGFDISNARHVHLGDHLFYEPVMRAFRDRGVDVVVAPMPAARDYFREAGYQVVEPAEVLRQDLRISSVWMYGYMPRRARRERFIYLNPIDHHITGPVAEYLAEHTLHAARIDPGLQPIDGRPYLVNPGPTPLDNESGKWMVFNDTVSSGWFRVTPRDRRAVARAAEEMRRDGYRIVRVGTEAERLGRPELAGVVDLDLRGRTSVMDLFRLLRSPKVAGTVSFDHVVAHMGMACGKPAIIRLRRMSRPHAEFMKRFLIPPFASGRDTPVRFI